MGLFEGHQEMGKNIGGDVVTSANLQKHRSISVWISFERFLNEFGLGQNRLHGVKKLFALVRQLNALTLSSKELRAKFFFQQFQLLGNGRLASVQDLGSFSDVRYRTNAFENSQLMECHDRLPQKTSENIEGIV
jgi:hypothetical protein